MAATPQAPSRVNDRRLYILAAILTPLIVLAGFARTYYLKPFFDTPDIDASHAHGRASVEALHVAKVRMVEDLALEQASLVADEENDQTCNDEAGEHEGADLDLSGNGHAQGKLARTDPGVTVSRIGAFPLLPNAAFGRKRALRPSAPFTRFAR